MERFFESCDIALEIGISPGLVRREAQHGMLIPDAVTARGARLYRESTVREYIAERRKRGLQHLPRPGLLG